MTAKTEVRNALDRLAGFLTARGAQVEYAHLPDPGDGKTGLDDYLAAGHTVDELWALVAPTRDRPQPNHTGGRVTSRR